MADPNPYESPKSDQPPKSGRMVRRGIGVGMIALLTPVVLHVAVFLGTVAGLSLLNTVQAAGVARPDAVIVFVFLAPPIFALVAMIVWAVRVHVRNSRSAGNTANAMTKAGSAREKQ